MATFNELAKQYAERLAQSYNRTAEADKIVSEINNLIYSSNNQPLTVEDKQELAKLILPAIKETYAFKSSDNSEFLNLINYIYSKLGQKK